MDVQREVERVYERVQSLVADPEHQHLHPYQLTARLERLREQHLAELEEQSP